MFMLFWLFYLLENSCCQKSRVFSRNGCRIFHREDIEVLPGRLFDSVSHQGVDYNTHDQKLVQYALGKGKVVEVDSWTFEGGQARDPSVFIFYPSLGYVGGYYHIERALVKKGDIVNSDTPVAITGGKGDNINGVHLHFGWMTKYNFDHPVGYKWYVCEDFESFFFNDADWCSSRRNSRNSTDETLSGKLRAATQTYQQKHNGMYRAHTQQRGWLDWVLIGNQENAGWRNDDIDALQVSNNEKLYGAHQKSRNWWTSVSKVTESVSSCGNACAGDFGKYVDGVKADGLEVQARVKGSTSYSDWKSATDGVIFSGAIDAFRLRYPSNVVKTSSSQSSSSTSVPQKYVQNAQYSPHPKEHAWSKNAFGHKTACWICSQGCYVLSYLYHYKLEVSEENVKKYVKNGIFQSQLYLRPYQNNIVAPSIGYRRAGSEHHVLIIASAGAGKWSIFDPGKSPNLREVNTNWFLKTRPFLSGNLAGREGNGNETSEEYLKRFMNSAASMHLVNDDDEIGDCSSCLESNEYCIFGDGGCRARLCAEVTSDNVCDSVSGCAWGLADVKGEKESASCIESSVVTACGQYVSETSCTGFISDSLCHWDINTETCDSKIPECEDYKSMTDCSNEDLNAKAADGPCVWGYFSDGPGEEEVALSCGVATEASTCSQYAERTDCDNAVEWSCVWNDDKCAQAKCQAFTSAESCASRTFDDTLDGPCYFFEEGGCLPLRCETLSGRAYPYACANNIISSLHCVESGTECLERTPSCSELNLSLAGCNSNANCVFLFNSDTAENVYNSEGTCVNTEDLTGCSSFQSRLQCKSEGCYWSTTMSRCKLSVGDECNLAVDREECENAVGKFEGRNVTICKWASDRCIEVDCNEIVAVNDGAGVWCPREWGCIGESGTGLCKDSTDCSQFNSLDNCRGSLSLKGGKWLSCNWGLSENGEGHCNFAADLSVSCLNALDEFSCVLLSSDERRCYWEEQNVNDDGTHCFPFPSSGCSAADGDDDTCIRLYGSICDYDLGTNKCIRKCEQILDTPEGCIDSPKCDYFGRLNGCLLERLVSEASNSSCPSFGKTSCLGSLGNSCIFDDINGCTPKQADEEDKGKGLNPVSGGILVSIIFLMMMLFV